MNIWDKMRKLLTDPSYRFTLFASHGLYNYLSDEKYIYKKYYAKLNKKLNISNPKTFNEKIQWLKLYDRKKIYTTMVDKYEVKKYVASIIGEKYIIPTLGVWEHFDDINFDSLPDSFVLKCTHDSGGTVIVKDKSQLEITDAKKKINKSLNRNYYLQGREWPYKNVKPRILAEEYLFDNRNECTKNSTINGLIDYKFYCFNGEPRFLYVGFSNIQNGEKHDQMSFFDFDWNPTPFYRADHERLPFKVKKPDNLNEMIEIARKLSQGIPFIRVDLYNISGDIFFSELTFASGGGFSLFYPEEWEKKLGDWINLPPKYNDSIK